MKRDDAIAAMEAMLNKAEAEDRYLDEVEGVRYAELKLIANAKETIVDEVIEQPANPTRAIGAPAVHTRRGLTPAGLLRSAIALACGERGIDHGPAAEFDKEVRHRNPGRKFEGAVAFSAKALLVTKAMSALPGGNAAATVGDQFFDSLFFKVDDAIDGPRLATALGVGTIVASEQTIHITQLEGKVTPAWIARDGDVGDSDAVFDAIEVGPKSIGTNVVVRRSALLYGSHPSVEPFLMTHLRDAMLDALDNAVLYGTGASNQPTGVSEVAQAGGALTTLASAYSILNRLISYQKSDAGIRWLLPHLAQAYMATTESFTGSAAPVMSGSSLAGYPAVLAPIANDSSPPAATQEYMVGNWSFAHLVVWDAVSLLANPYGATYKSGGVELRVLADANVLIRDPSRFLQGAASVLPG